MWGIIAATGCPREASLREYIVSEAMAALGIPTTRALAAVTTGEQLWRETPLPGAVLTRVASSHIRVGTFLFFAARGDLDAIRRVADHVIARHYPEAVDAANRYRTLLNLVISRQAALVAKWQLVGFIHGVMNTSFDDWAVRWRHRLAEEGIEVNARRVAMRAANPAFIPRNHQVEEAISAAVNVGYFQPFESLLTVLSMPYEDQPAFGRYVDPPRPDQVVHQTFCGT